MHFKRRSVLGLIGASAVVPAFARAGMPELRAAAMQLQLAPKGYAPSELWCFNESSPGPELRYAQGARLEQRFVNGLGEPSAVHWHGLRLPNAMDGVPGLTQAAVKPGESFDYTFTLPDAGSYWYHSHNRSVEQIARGLYGPLIIEEANPPSVDADITLVIDDWRLAENGSLMGDFGNFHDNSHAGRLGNFVTVNGAENYRIPARMGDRLRLRLINTANARIFDLGWRGLRAWIVALDGMPLEAAMPADQVTLAPAQRADVIVDVMDDPETVIFMSNRGENYAVIDFDRAAAPAPSRDAPMPLPPNPIAPVEGWQQAATKKVAIEGGAMRWLESAEHNGETLAGRPLAAKGQAWALNGVVGLAEEPLLNLRAGQVQRIAFENRTGWPHAMHMHGHHFREIRADGTLGPWHDSILIERSETREIAFNAENPGKWLLHCHMLGHQAAGMKTWLQIG